MSDPRILELIYAGISELNQNRQDDQRISLEPEAPLFGQGGKLDSLALVALILDIEERIADVFGQTVTLASDRAMSQTASPFRTPASLVKYIDLLLRETQQ